MLQQRHWTNAQSLINKFKCLETPVGDLRQSRNVRQQVAADQNFAIKIVFIDILYRSLSLSTGRVCANEEKNPIFLNLLPFAPDFPVQNTMRSNKPFNRTVILVLVVWDVSGDVIYC